MREPHWHPITAELGYEHKGRAHMTILDPDGGTDTYTLKPGDMYYIPRHVPAPDRSSASGRHRATCLYLFRPTDVTGYRVRG